MEFACEISTTCKQVGTPACLNNSKVQIFITSENTQKNFSDVKNVQKYDLSDT